MDFPLVVQLCGIPLLLVLVTLGSALTLFAIFLVFRLKQVMLLVAFMPLTMLPIMAGLVSALMGILNSVSLHLDSDTQFVDTGFLLLVNLVPVFVGALAAMPSFVIVIVGRWMLTWRASGARLLSAKQVEDEGGDVTSTQQTPNDYVRQPIRLR